jgi:hypothetical protein
MASKIKEPHSLKQFYGFSYNASKINNSSCCGVIKVLLPIQCKLRENIFVWFIHCFTGFVTSRFKSSYSLILKTVDRRLYFKTINEFLHNMKIEGKRTPI